MSIFVCYAPWIMQPTWSRRFLACTRVCSRAWQFFPDIEFTAGQEAVKARMRRCHRRLRPAPLIAAVCLSPSWLRSPIATVSVGNAEGWAVGKNFQAYQTARVCYLDRHCRLLVMPRVGSRQKLPGMPDRSSVLPRSPPSPAGNAEGRAAGKSFPACQAAQVCL